MTADDGERRLRWTPAVAAGLVVGLVLTVVLDRVAAGGEAPGRRVVELVPTEPAEVDLASDATVLRDEIVRGLRDDAPSGQSVVRVAVAGDRLRLELPDVDDWRTVVDDALAVAPASVHLVVALDCRDRDPEERYSRRVETVGGRCLVVSDRSVPSPDLDVNATRPARCESTGEQELHVALSPEGAAALDAFAAPGVSVAVVIRGLAVAVGDHRGGIACPEPLVVGDMPAKAHPEVRRLPIIEPRPSTVRALRWRLTQPGLSSGYSVATSSTDRAG